MTIIKRYTCSGRTGELLEIIFRMFEEITVGVVLLVCLFSVLGIYILILFLYLPSGLCVVILRVPFTSPDQIRKFQLR